MKQKSVVTPDWVSPYATTLYFDNNISKPEGFSNDEYNNWLARMLGSASCNIPPEIWARLRKEAAEDVLKTRTPTEVAK